MIKSLVSVSVGCNFAIKFNSTGFFVWKMSYHVLKVSENVGIKGQMVQNYCLLHLGHYKIDITNFSLTHEMDIVYNLAWKTVESFCAKTTQPQTSHPVTYYQKKYGL